MRIFQGFLILVTAAILWMLPVAAAIYDFRTDIRTDTFRDVATASGITTATVILSRPMYEANTDTCVIYSDLGTDVPVVNSYDEGTRELEIGGLTDDSERTFTILYDINALDVHPAMDWTMDIIPFIWILCIIAFPVVGLAAILVPWYFKQ